VSYVDNLRTSCDLIQLPLDRCE